MLCRLRSLARIGDKPWRFAHLQRDRLIWRLGALQPSACLYHLFRHQLDQALEVAELASALETGAALYVGVHYLDPVRQRRRVERRGRAIDADQRPVEGCGY